MSGDSSDEQLTAAVDAYRSAVQAYEAELRERYSLPKEAQAQFAAAVTRCFESACEALQASHAALRETEAANARVLNSRGDLPEDLAAAYEAQRKSFEGLQRTAASLGEVLDRPLPDLADSLTTRLAGGAGAAEEGGRGAEGGEAEPMQVARGRAVALILRRHARACAGLMRACLACSAAAPAALALALADAPAADCRSSRMRRPALSTRACRTSERSSQGCSWRTAAAARRVAGRRAAATAAAAAAARRRAAAVPRTKLAQNQLRPARPLLLLLLLPQRQTAAAAPLMQC